MAERHEPIEGRCNARKTNGTGDLCRKTAGWGTDHTGFGRCVLHTGGTVNGRKHGARLRAQGMVGELIEEALGVVQAMSGVDQLVMAIEHAGAMSLGYRWLLDELPVESEWSFEVNHDDKGSKQRFVKVTEAGLVGPDAQGQMKLHAYEEGYRHWTKLHAQLLKTAHDMGIEERRQALAETQVAQVGDAIRAIVEGLGRQLDDPEVVPIVERSLRIVAGAA